jgi:hypothetical protein
MEDLKRIKGGYRPQNHFFSLYSIISIFVIIKLFSRQFLRHYFLPGGDMISKNTHCYFERNNDNRYIHYVRKDVTKLTK